MNIYDLRSDYDNFKFFVFNEDDNYSTDYLNFKGQSLSENWNPLSFVLFKDKRKKRDLRREDFDASCYFEGILIVNEKLKSIFETHLKNLIEILDVKTEIGKYYFINVVNVIPALKDEENLTVEEIMEMVRKNKYVFDEHLVENQYIFRDKCVPSTYFVSENFVELMKSNDIKGLSYE